MEKRRRIGGDDRCGGMEENTMAILDTSGFSGSKISHHLDDDRLAFLEAVRTASLLPENGSAPTRRMFEAIFHILKDVDSLDLIIESYQLLLELDKRFPRLYLSKGEESDSSSPSKVLSHFVMVEEAWSPFNFGLDSYNEKGEATNCSKSSVDSLVFHSLIQEIGKVSNEMKPEAVETTFLKNMLLLQYLINVLEGDFWPRNCTYQGKMSFFPCSVQTRRSSTTINTETFDGVLKCLSNSSSTRSIIKKISTEVVQLLLAYAFQAYLALSYHVSEGLSDSMEDVKSNSVEEVCKNIISAFTCLRQADPHTGILSIGKEALFTAAAILPTKS
ncbi:hypothetical protein CDL12_16987 [Handroanthus impetiginosus]|uniref:Uncharacterized protein n=1 Tax=Handroanthus impetiginosus TaxID=429701 RepID=A0A2G9GYS9_9LAMI|nr:hypothetical protein CDL12_16987 [Handroanthus impetiginosus]